MSLLPPPIPDLDTETGTPQPPQDPPDRLLSQQHRRQLFAWWSYGLAAESFAAVAMTAFIPLVLEGSARAIGWQTADPTMRCSIKEDDNPSTPSAGPSSSCRAKIGPFDVDTASFSLYTYSSSVLVQALLIISLSHLANSPTYRKRLLLTFTIIGSLASLLFPILSSPAVLASLAILAIACFGVSFVCFNAYLPGLGKDSDRSREAWRTWQDEVHRLSESRVFEGGTGGAAGSDERPGLMLPGLEFSAVADQEDHRVPHGSPSSSNVHLDNLDDPSAPLLKDLLLVNQSHQATLTTLRQSYLSSISLYTSQISLYAVAIAYTGGALLLLPSFAIVAAMEESLWSLRLVVGASGAVWGLLAIPGAVWLKGRGDGKEKLQKQQPSQDRGGSGGLRRLGENVKESWIGLLRMLKPSETKRLRMTFIFLVSWMFLSDAASTFSSTAIIFAKTALHMPSSSVIIVAFLAQITGILGASLCPALQRRLQWTNKKCLIVLVALMALLPLYGIAGLVMGGTGVGGLRTPGEMYVVAAIFGLVFGPIQSFSRTVFSELIPPGEEARFFALYSVTDKASSFLGPFVVGLLADLTGEIRYGFIFLLLMLILPLPLLGWAVDVERGREDAGRYAKERERRERGEVDED